MQLSETVKNGIYDGKLKKITTQVLRVFFKTIRRLLAKIINLTTSIQSNSSLHLNDYENLKALKNRQRSFTNCRSLV